MKNPHHAKFVFSITLAIVIAVFTGFGVIGYAVYGSDLEGSIILNLASQHIGETM